MYFRGARVKESKEHREINRPYVVIMRNSEQRKEEKQTFRSFWEEESFN